MSTRTPDCGLSLTRKPCVQKTQICVNASRRSAVFLRVTFLVQGPQGAGRTYDHTAADNGQNGGAVSLGISGERAEPEEAAVAPCWSQQQFWTVLAEIHDIHYRSLVRLAALFRGVAGEDVVQEAYVRVARRWDGIREADKVLVYVRRAVVNGAIDERRHRRRVDVLSLDALCEGPLPRQPDDRRPPRFPPGAGPEEIALRHLADDAVVACVRRLPGRQRECIGLRFCLSLSEKETAEVLGINPGSVKRHVSRAMEKLRPALENYR